MILRKTDLALQIILTMINRAADYRMPSEQIAKQLAISSSYVESILKTLRDKGLVTSTRGPKGGYKINVDPASISAWDVVEQFECAEQEGESTSKSASAPLPSYELGLLKTIEEHLSKTMLIDLAKNSPS
jgi:Rrf2 family protein